MFVCVSRRGVYGRAREQTIGLALHRLGGPGCSRLGAPTEGLDEVDQLAHFSPRARAYAPLPSFRRKMRAENATFRVALAAPLSGREPMRT